MTVAPTVAALDNYSGPYELDSDTRIAFVSLSMVDAHDAVERVDFIHRLGTAVVNLAHGIGLRHVYQVIPLNFDWLAAPGTTFFDYSRSMHGAAGVQTLGRGVIRNLANLLPEYATQTTTGLVFNLMIFGR